MRYLKKIKYLIMMLIFISFSYSIEFDISEKQVKDGIVYRRGEKNSFTGVFIGENIREEYKKGVRNGKYIGVIKIEKDEYICEGEFVEGIKNGRMIVYNKEGQIVQSTIYKENNEVDIKGNIIEKADNKSDTKDNILIRFKNISYDLEYIKYNEVLSNL